MHIDTWLGLNGKVLPSTQRISIISYVKVNVEITTINSLDDVGENDHLLMLVNDIPKNGGVDPSGLASSIGGSVAAVESGSASRDSNHEVGHLLGLSDQYKVVDGKPIDAKPGNVMSNGGGKDARMLSTFD